LGQYTEKILQFNPNPIQFIGRADNPARADAAERVRYNVALLNPAAFEHVLDDSIDEAVGEFCRMAEGFVYDVALPSVVVAIRPRMNGAVALDDRLRHVVSFGAGRIFPQGIT
jgi:hypothetical protein